MVQLSPTSAKLKWKSKDVMGRVSSPVLIGGNLYDVSEPGDLVCLDPTSGKARWKKSGFDCGGILFVDGVLIAQNGAGSGLMVRPSPDAYIELGKWSPFSGQSFTAPIISNGKYMVRDTHVLGCYSAR